jgi:hypothetical protein
LAVDHLSELLMISARMPIAKWPIRVSKESVHQLRRRLAGHLFPIQKLYPFAEQQVLAINNRKSGFFEAWWKYKAFDVAELHTLFLTGATSEIH